MERKGLGVIERTEFKKGAAKRLRKAGGIPAIVYGQGEPRAVVVDRKEFHDSFKVISENTVIKLTDEKGGSREVLLKDYQGDITTGEIGHIDFFEIKKGKTLRTHIPIACTGTPVGVREGGLLEQKLDELEVECLPKDLPETLPLDIAHLCVGDSIHVKDLPPPKGVRFLSLAEQTVVVVTHAKGEAVASEEEEEAEEAEIES